MSAIQLSCACGLLSGDVNEATALKVLRRRFESVPTESNPLDKVLVGAARGFVGIVACIAAAMVFNTLAGLKARS